MSAQVRRASRHHRCARCGYKATYPNAGAVEARSWFNRHSCQKRERLAVRQVMAEIREAAIDRTPKPCLHKEADHQHGTRACYVLDRCRCTPCSGANSEAENERERMKAYGRYHKYVDAYPIRLHLAELREYGIGLKQVSRVSGVSNGSLTKIWYGLYADTGRGHERRLGEGELVRGPARRVLRTTAERIYAVEPIPQNLGSRRPDHQRTPQARLHLQALVALGWSMSKIADRLGISGANFTPVIHGRRVMSRGTVDQVEALFEELSMTLPPRREYRDKIAYTRVINYARKAGWLPPLDLEVLENNDELDDEGLDIDDAAVLRALDGDRTVTLTADERREVIRLLHRRGLTDRQISDLTGFNSVVNERKRLGLSVNKSGIDWSEYGERPRNRQKEAS
jgi:transcriptional regulator with XRE-family HTH domain